MLHDNSVARFPKRRRHTPDDGARTMRIVLPDSAPDEFARLEKRIHDGTIFYESFRRPDSCRGHDHHLGWSRDDRAWALALNFDYSGRYAERGTHDPRDRVAAILVDPPKRERHTIGDILVRVHSALDASSADRPRSEIIDEAVRSVPFPVYRTVGSHLPEAPESWLELPARIGLDMDLSEGACIYRELIEEFSRESLVEALKVVCSPRLPGLLVGYALVATEVVPLLRWNVDWPLSRRGKAHRSGVPPSKATFPGSTIPIPSCSR